MHRGIVRVEPILKPSPTKPNPSRRVMITRPYQDGVAVASRLTELGMVPLVEPVVEILPGPDELSSELTETIGCQAIVFTSAHGADSLARHLANRRVQQVSALCSLPVFAVGEVTALAARAAGFTKVAVAAGDSRSLIALIASSLKPEQGLLIHFSGSVVAGDIAGQLQRQGFTVNRISLYTATPVASLSHAGVTALRAGDCDAVLFYSPRTVRIFESLVAAAELLPNLRAVAAICLSQAVADACQASYKQVRVARTANESSMIESLLVEFSPLQASSAAMARQSRGELAVESEEELALPNPPAPGATGAQRLIHRLAGGISAILLLGLAAAALLWARPDFRQSLRSLLPAGWSQEASAPAEPKGGAGEPVSALQKPLPAGENTDAPAKAWQARLDGLEEQLQSQTRLLNETQTQLLAVNRRLEQVNRQKSNGREPAASKVAILAIAVTELSGALSRGDSLQPGLTAIRGIKNWHPSALVIPDSLLARLQPFAESGVTGLNQLAAEFPSYANAAFRAEQRHNQQTLWEKLKAALSRLVVIRHKSGAKPGSLDQRLSMVESLLQQGNLSAAVTMVEALPEATQPIFAPWLLKAKQRLEVSALVAELSQLMVKELAQESP
ncbi:MAG: uroporphyrinogen-III synthase [Alphaproteobacteria bacterium]|nr:uroporphyrinogen-III synthase [Alphaproteobacteria bacterium]